jgi:dTDP-4-amino-4,6-dideoxygalactose transaminase
MRKPPKNDFPIMNENDGIVLFYPHVPQKAKDYVCDTLDSRWLGQGPKVDLFEARLKTQFDLTGACLSTGSGTDALHLAYLLAGIKAGDEVLCPLFTCTATNIPLLYIGAKPVFVDVDPRTLNMCVKDLKNKISEKTKAIVCVHYGGLPCDMDDIKALANDYSIPVIEDAAHALGAKYNGHYVGKLSEYTIFSFQAIKLLTTGDGGMLVMQNADQLNLAQKLRWFGIDRTDKQKGVWENDIVDVGYKYQMTDIGAALGLAGLEEFAQTLSLRQSLYQRYVDNLSSCSDVTIVNDFSPKKEHAAWLFTVLVKNRINCQLKLRDKRIESGQTHYRNDRYSIFQCNDPFPNMDAVDDDYLVLPLHTRMTLSDVDLICDVIKSGW